MIYYGEAENRRDILVVFKVGVRMDKKKTTKSNPKEAIIVTVLFVGLLFLFYLLFTALFSGNKTQGVEASIFKYHAVNPSMLSVEYRVTNTTETPGYSDCSITMSDESMKYHGNDFGYESAKVIQPGETYSGVASVTVSNGGAEYVTKGGIKCTIKQAR